MRRDHPEKVCNLLYDKLYVDDTVYVFNDPLGQVVEQSSDLRWTKSFQVGLCSAGSET